MTEPSTALTRTTLTRTMVAWIPDWPITAVRRSEQLPVGRPLALVDKGIIFACSSEARAEGVKRGLRVREAQARCPELTVLAYEPAHDSRSFEPVITAIEEMMPGVQLLRPGTCAIRSRGPARYYGSEKAAGLSLVGLLAELGIPGARVGIADGPFTAEQAARAMDGTSVTIVPQGESAAFLAPFPVAVLADAELIPLLHRLGIRTMAEFAALPMRSVRDRFGEPAARLHSLAAGLDSRAVAARIPPKHLDVQVDFEPALDRIDQVTFSFRASADRFLEQLTAEKLVCTAIRVEVDTESGEVSERSWLHPRVFSAADVVDRVRWQLQGSGEIDVGLRSGITRVRVVPESVDAIGNHEHGLWGTAPDERIHNGLARVQSMLGHNGVLTAAIGGGRMLAERATLVAWGDSTEKSSAQKSGTEKSGTERSGTSKSSAAKNSTARNSSHHRASKAAQPWPGQLPSPAPATVFSSPHPVHVFDASGTSVMVDERGTLSAPPVSFSATAAATTLRQITAWAGPWLVDQRWWDDDEGRRASRFQVVDSTGSAWLLVLDGEHWLLEAKYD